MSVLRMRSIAFLFNKQNIYIKKGYFKFMLNKLRD